MSAQGKESYRTVFVSDVHLGSRGCRADALAGFPKSMTRGRPSPSRPWLP
jgi:hypothetical protein